MKRLNLFLGAAALIAVSLTASPAVMAQENGNRDEDGKVVRGPYETNRFGDNWFIGVGGGINVFWNEGLGADNMKISPSVDFNFGKWEQQPLVDVFPCVRYIDHDSNLHQGQ